MLVSNALKSGDIKAHYRNNYVPLPGVDHSLGKKVYIHNSQLVSYKKLESKKNKHFGVNYVLKQLKLLKGPGLVQSLFHKSSAVSKVLPFEGGQIKYAALDGELFIDEIQITGPLGLDSKKHPAGTYRIKRQVDSDTLWAPDSDAEMNVDQVGVVNTKHLAINGISNDMRDAANFMPDFIEHGFGKASLSNTYSLFYIPGKNTVEAAYKSLKDSLGVKELESAKKLADVFEQLSVNKNEVNLTVHGSGHAIFRSALKKVKQKNIQLPNITVYYANATTNLSTVDNQRKQSGMKLHDKAPLLNPLSIQQSYLSGNIVSGAHVGMRATPEDKISIGIKAGKQIAGLAGLGAAVLGTGGVSVLATGSALAGAVTFAGGSMPALNKQALDGTEKVGQQAVKEVYKTAKLVWSPVHKMMVKG